MARDTGKALDNVIDWANGYKGKIAMAIARLEMFSEDAPTKGERIIIDAIKALLEDEPK